ncbi:hypothetical protein [Herbidospora daliensis]|uniref:hypothetical protein n=1 Tax=Herbidospora daliensis TaxID=295585 RepID=UPI0007C6E7DE
MSLYWFTGSGASSADILCEGMRAYREMSAAASGRPSAPPQGIAVYAADMTIRPLADWSEFDRGGHFPAMETSDMFAGDLCAFFRVARERARVRSEKRIRWGGRPLSAVA